MLADEIIDKLQILPTDSLRSHEEIIPYNFQKLREAMLSMGGWSTRSSSTEIPRGHRRQPPEAGAGHDKMPHLSRGSAGPQTDHLPNPARSAPRSRGSPGNCLSRSQRQRPQSHNEAPQNHVYRDDGSAPLTGKRTQRFGPGARRQNAIATVPAAIQVPGGQAHRVFPQAAPVGTVKMIRSGTWDTTQL